MQVHLPSCVTVARGTLDWQNGIMPSLNEEMVNDLVSRVDTLRDKCIIKLFFDSGMTLKELTNIKRYDIDWDNLTVTIIGKGNKQRKAPFTQETATMIKEYLGENHATGAIWGINKNGIDTIIRRLSRETGIKFSCHSFRRGFAATYIARAYLRSTSCILVAGLI